MKDNNNSSNQQQQTGDNRKIEEYFNINSFDKLPDNTKYQFAEFLVSTLRKYFYKYGNDNTRNFCNIVLDSIIKVNKFEKDIKVNFRNQLCGYEAILSVKELLDKVLVISSKGECLVILCRLFVCYLEKGVYDSRYRTWMKKVCLVLEINFLQFEECEDYLVNVLSINEYIENEDQKRARLKNERNKKIKRYALIGVAGVVGGTLIGLTGGLAAPLIASGAGAIVGTSLTAGLATTAGAAILGIGFGVAGAGLTGYKMKTRIGNIEQFEFLPISNKQSLHTLLTVTGWIREDDVDEFVKPWRNLRVSGEEYTLVYESEHLLTLGQSLKLLLKTIAGAAVEKALQKTILAGLLNAVAWPMAILSVADIIDNPWHVCMSRSEEVGEILADVIIKRQHGQKPLNLIGFSIGARVIYYCLLKLADMENSQGIIENVILLGAPVSASPEQWENASNVVSGQIINGYSTTDWILKFLYRTMNVQFSIAGITPIEVRCFYKEKIINRDLTKFVNGHLKYAISIDNIMNELGVKMEKKEGSISTTQK
uniref:Transmembrane and coiled-coil domain-containing protein 4 n=1 Tax=Parastrongyloides trichosuri TaxID=131310 RepID=A0A0N4ZD18_PARTI